MKILGMGVPELLIILAVILLIFGPKNLPKLGSALGKTVKNLREGIGSKDDAEEVEEGSDRGGRRGRAGGEAGEEDDPQGHAQEVRIARTALVRCARPKRRAPHFRDRLRPIRQAADWNKGAP